MEKRLELQALLETILGSRNVYYQPPAQYKMSYPCIVYQRDNVKTDFADNKPYSLDNRYEITIIDRDPDSLIPGMIARLPSSSFSRRFTSDQLNHDVYNLYF